MVNNPPTISDGVCMACHLANKECNFRSPSFQLLPMTTSTFNSLMFPRSRAWERKSCSGYLLIECSQKNETKGSRKGLGKELSGNVVLVSISSPKKFCIKNCTRVGHRLRQKDYIFYHCIRQSLSIVHPKKDRIGGGCVVFLGEAPPCQEQFCREGDSYKWLLVYTHRS